ncbi:cytochrome P450 [Xylariaceae sp. FL0804]|nr:cytochrome P450 [Xylariaceae sp. FL0804]
MSGNRSLVQLTNEIIQNAAQWKLYYGWIELGSYVIPEVQRQKEIIGHKEATTNTTSPDLISWMLKDGRTDLKRDPEVLTTLRGSIRPESIYNIANFVCRALDDLTAHPDVLNSIRAEIHDLESAMKEAARLAPGTMIVHSRVVGRECNLGGVKLDQGQFITIVNTDILTWRGGRWACPGRQFADMCGKILLIKLIDENDFAFVNGKRIHPSTFHEFLFFHPEHSMLVWRRNEWSALSGNRGFG